MGSPADAMLDHSISYFSSGSVLVSTQNWVVRSAMQETPRTLCSLCGLITVFYAFGWFTKDKRLATFGLVVGLLAASLALLPELAYN